MVLVIEYGEEHSGCVEVVPPSPNSSTGSDGQKSRIRLQHQRFESGVLFQAGPSKHHRLAAFHTLSSNYQGKVSVDILEGRLLPSFFSIEIASFHRNLD